LYLTFYGLRDQPFNTTPDPRFLYLTPGHREVLAQLLYGVQESKGFILMTAEVGTGKTTLLHTLCQRLNGNTEVAFIFNPKLPFDSILEYMLEDFGIAKAADSHVRRLFALNNFLIERRRAGQNTVLIIDEAQNLDATTLEQVRLLSNFETPTEKLLQILLVGQPELKAKLEGPELRQLKQRIGLRCSIPSLTAEETRDYVRHRLHIAGAYDAGLFTDRAMSRIAEYASGNPRVVNILCDHCLLIGYADQQRRIKRDIVEQAIEYLEGEQRPRRRKWDGLQRSRLAPRHWVFLALAAGFLGWMTFLALPPESLAHVTSLVVEPLHGLAHVVRDLLSKIALIARGIFS
jgi:general secretion pathway protein A